MYKSGNFQQRHLQEYNISIKHFHTNKPNFKDVGYHTMFVSIFLRVDNQNINSNTKYICINYTNNNNNDRCSNYSIGKNI